MSMRSLSRTRGLFFEILVNSLVFFSEGEYNFECLGFIVVIVNEAGQNVMEFFGAWVSS